MSGFDERKSTEEAKYALDAALKFKATARRNKLLGLWAAGLMGVTGDAAAEYAKEVVRSDFEAPGDDDVFAKVHGDLTARGVEQSDHQVRRQMDELMDLAIQQVKSEAG